MLPADMAIQPHGQCMHWKPVHLFGNDRQALPVCSTGECVSVNFGQHPFRFSVEAMIQEEAEQQDAAVQR